MSFCRLDEDCDLLAYESEDGLVDIILRGAIENLDYTIPAGLDELQEMEYTVKHFDKLYKPWDNVRCGEKYWSLTPLQAEGLLRNLRADGVRFPDSVFEEVIRLFDPADLYEPTLGDVAEARPI